MRETSLLGQQLPWPAFAGEGACIFAHEPDIAKMNEAGIEGNVHHDLKVCLTGQLGAEAGIIVTHEAGCVVVMPNQPVPTSMTFRRSIHKEMHFVQGNYPEKIAGSCQMFPQAGPVPADDAGLPEFPSTSSKSSWISCSPYLSCSMANLFNTRE